MFVFMEDPESKNSLVNNAPTIPSAIKLCGINIRVKHETLLLSEIIRIACILCLVQTSCAIFIVFLREPIKISFIGNIRWLSVASIGIMTVMYGLIYMNLKSGGWGAEDSRFWCDIKIMYVRGFNTIRTVSRIFTAICLTILLGVISDSGHIDTLIFASTLAVMAEWQAGLSENQNQYDVRLDSKFLSENNALLLEPLNDYQNSHPKENISWSPFVVHTFIKILLHTTLLLTHSRSSDTFEFESVVQSIIWLYMVFLPVILDAAYLKHACSFVVIEIYRMLVDVFILGALVWVSLV